MVPVAGSMVLWGEGSEMGQWLLPAFLSGRKLSLSSCLDTRHFHSSLYATGVFQATLLVWDLRGSKFEVSLCVGSQRGTAWGSRNFFHQLKPASFCNQKLWTRKFLALEPWAGTPPSQEIPPKFLSTTHGHGTSLFHISAPPTSLDGLISLIL